MPDIKVKIPDWRLVAPGDEEIRRKLAGLLHKPALPRPVGHPGAGGILLETPFQPPSPGPGQLVEQPGRPLVSVMPPGELAPMTPPPPSPFAGMPLGAPWEMPIEMAKTFKRGLFPAIPDRRPGEIGWEAERRREALEEAPPVGNFAQWVGRVAGEAFVYPRTPQEMDNWIDALFFAAPPGAIATGGISAGIREAKAVARGIREAGRVTGQAGERIGPFRTELGFAEGVKPPRVPKGAKPPVAGVEPEPRPFYAHILEKGTSQRTYVEIKDAKPITIPGFEDIDAFISRPFGLTEGWLITDAKVGLIIGSGTTRAHAVDTAASQLAKAGRENYQTVVANAISAQGLSPRYGRKAPVGEPSGLPQPKPPEVIAPKPEAVAPGVAKEPWEMTMEEWKSGFVKDWKEAERRQGIKGIGPLGKMHKDRVRKALTEGKPVPPEVLKDYPDLVARGVAPSVEAVSPKLAKEYWEMTQREIVAEHHKTYRRAPDLDERSGMFRAHYMMIKERLERGLPVPPKVLKAYPDLVAQAGKVAPEVRPEAVAVRPAAEEYTQVAQRVAVERNENWMRSFYNAARAEAQKLGVPDDVAHDIAGRASLNAGQAALKSRTAEYEGLRQKVVEETRWLIGEWKVKPVTPVPTAEPAPARIPEPLPERAAEVPPPAPAEAAQLPPQTVAPPFKAVPPPAAPITAGLGGAKPPPPGGIIPPTTPPPHEPPPVIIPGPGAQTAFGIRPIRAGLNRTEKLLNIAKKPVKGVLSQPVVSGAFRESARIRAVSTSRGTVLSQKMTTQLDKVFQVRSDETIPILAGIDPLVSGAPTVQDVAARLPRYWETLTADQRLFFLALRDELSPFRTALREVGVEIPSRLDIVPGGFYVPRGRAALEGADEPLKVRAPGLRGVKKGFERPAIFDSMAEGISRGYKYAPLEDSLASYVRDAGGRVADKHITDFFKVVTDETGMPLGETVKMRLLRQNPELATRIESLRQNIVRLRSLLARLTQRQEEVLTKFFADPTFEDIDALHDTLTVLVKAGPNKGVAASELRQVLRQSQQELAGLMPDYKFAMRRAQVIPRDQGAIGLSGLQGWSFPDAMANAANKILEAQMPPSGANAIFLKTVGMFNNLYRGFTATADNSAVGIQALLGWADDSAATVRALKVNLRSWVDPRAYGEYLKWFDDIGRARGLPNSAEAAEAGLRLGASETEFALGMGGALGRLPVAREANRAFGVMGDTLRLGWMRDEVAAALRKGKTWEMMKESGEAERIAEAINNATGWSKGRTFGSMGDLIQYAPRFFQSRLETGGRAILSARPGASIEQRLARRALLKLVGGAVILTTAANYALGQETEYRPIVNGRWNSNFLRIRFGGRDWSLLGTWDSLARIVVFTAQGKPFEALRGMGSGLVTVASDLIINADFLGKPVRDNPKIFAQWLLNTFSPFAFEELPSAAGQAVKAIRERQVEPAVAAVLTAIGEISGAKSAPVTAYEHFQEYAVTKLGKDWEEISEVERLRLQNLDSEGKQLWAEFKKTQEARRPGDEAFREMGRAHDLRVAKLTEEALRLDRGKIGPKELRETIQKTGQDLGAQYKLLETNPRYAKAIREWKARGLEPKDLPEDEAYRLYSAILFDDDLDLPDGGRDFVEQDRRLAELRAKIGENNWAKVKEMERLKRMDMPLAVQEYYEDQEKMRVYWDLWQPFGKTRSLELQKVWFTFREALVKDKPKARRLEKTEAIRSLNNKYDEYKEDWRVKNRPIEDLLIYWGYFSVPASEQLPQRPRIRRQRRARR